MDNIVKFQSREGGPFTVSQNRVNFSIPADGVYDLSKSYISLMSRINVVASGEDHGAVFAVALRYAKPDGTILNMAPPPASMVKNSRLTSSKFGVMEDIKRPDCFFTNISSLDQSMADIRGHAYEYPITPFERNNNKGSVFRELHKEGSVFSRDLVAPFKIPLSQFLSLGKATLDTKSLGRLDIHMELQLDRFKAIQLLTSADNFGNVLYKEMQDIGGIGTYNTLTSKQVFNRLEDSPYHVGQSVQMTVGADSVDGIDPPSQLLITQIDWIRTGDDYGKLMLTFNKPVATFVNATDKYVDINLIGRNSTSLEFLCEYAEITLQSSSEKVDMSNGLVYTTVLTEEDNGLGLTSFRKQYFLEPECYNIWTCFPDDDDDLRSDTSQIQSWRLRLDGVDLTNRNVIKKSPLDLDRISMSMLNSGRKLKSLMGVLPEDATQFELNTFILKESRMIANPVPITADKKLLDYSIEAVENGVKKLIIFKEVSKTIKM
jgi:hypothetical protein